MKKTIQTFLMISIFCFSYQFSFCQTSGQKEKKAYRVWVKKIDKSPTIKGDLKEVGDSLGITLPKYKHNAIQYISIKDIKYVEVRKKGKKGRGILVGTLAGITLGAVIGYTSYEEPKSTSNIYRLDFGPGLSTIGGGLLGVIPGAIVGAIVGGAKIKIPIQGSRSSIK